MLAAEIRIKEIIANTPKHVETEMFVPQESCGRIIGKGGQSIRELCSVSGKFYLYFNSCCLSVRQK